MSAPHDEIDAVAYDGLLDALGTEDLHLLAQEFLRDLERIGAALVALRTAPDGDKVKSHAHALAGLLGQYACLKAAAGARRAAEAEAKGAGLFLEDLVELAGRCGAQWRARLAHA